MRLLAITDLHDKRTALERILAAAGPADAILLGGDVTNFGTPADADRSFTIAARSGAKVLAVAGNCDSAAIDDLFIQRGASLLGRGVMLGEIGLHGLSAMPPWRRDMYYFTEDQLAEYLEAGYAQIAGAKYHVVLSHAPPRDGRVDCTHLGQHVGSTALRAFVDRRQPRLVLCGHIHEGRGIEQLGPTTVVNCGVGAAGSYALVELADRLTVELRQA
jgi:uncharacterized protein